MAKFADIATASLISGAAEGIVLRFTGFALDQARADLRGTMASAINCHHTGIGTQLHAARCRI